MRPSHFGHRLKIAKILNSKNEIEIYSKLISSNRLLELLKKMILIKKFLLKKNTRLTLCRKYATT